MKKSNTTLALMAAIAASASMAYAATDNGAQKEWLPGKTMSGTYVCFSQNVEQRDSACTIYTYDDKGRIVEREMKKYNKETDNFDDNVLYSYEYDETTGNVSLSLYKTYDSEAGEYVEKSKEVNTYTEDNNMPAISEAYVKDSKDADWVLTTRVTRTYEYDPVCGKVCKYVNVIADGENTSSNIESIAYDADGVPQEYVYTYFSDYTSLGGSKFTQKTIYNNFDWIDGYNVDFSKSKTWTRLSEALVASCKYDWQTQDIDEYEGTTTTKTRYGKREIVRKVENGKLSYTDIDDTRADRGKYSIVEYEQTDERGAYNRNFFSYENLAANESPSQEKLAFQTKLVSLNTSSHDYIEKEWGSTETPTELYLYREAAISETVNPSFGYEESKVQAEIIYNVDGSQNRKTVNITNYSDYKELIPNAITRIASDALHPRRIYTTDGVCVGNSTDNLPSGVYIVREGGHSMKVKK